jgi:S1-C subfamily serine protease
MRANSFGWLTSLTVLFTTSIGAFAKDVLVTGTAFAVTNSGHLITNYHVVQGCQDILVVQNGQRSWGKVVATGPSIDLAVVKVAYATPLLRSSSVKP